MSDSRTPSSAKSAAAASLLPVSTAGPQLLINRWMVRWSSTRSRRSSIPRSRSCSSPSSTFFLVLRAGGLVERSLGVEEVVMGLVGRVAGQAGQGERVDAVDAAVVHDDAAPVVGFH